MNTKHILTILISLVLFISCSTGDSVKKFTSRVENAHKKETYHSFNGSSFDAKITFGGNEILNAKLTFTNDSKLGKIEYKNGDIIIFNDNKVYTSPNFQHKEPRFHAYTWVYFFQLPYKLSDPGTVWSKHPSEEFMAGHLTFQPNTGDAPEDWYQLFAGKESGLLHHVAYIVTAHGTKEEAEKDPHVIQFEAYETKKNIPVSTKWTFWGWDNTAQELTKQIGEATLTNVTLTKEEPLGLFSIPEGFIEVKL